MKESKYLEYKEIVSNTFLKTVSAYANYGTGVIIFGVADNGTIKGIAEPEKTCLDIENRINDSIDPVPEYTLSINEKTSVITLRIDEGIHKPYLYKAKAYRRNDSATIQVDHLELSRLVLEGQNISFEEIPASKQQLEFEQLKKKLVEVLHIESFSLDTLRTLELYEDGIGYNKAGELLSDINKCYGIDIVRFGENISIILDRETLEHRSLLILYDQAMKIYRKYYQYEQIKGGTREKVILIPEEAFREAIANALVHRMWDVDTHIHVAMFPDKIEITSPGGLPQGVSEADFLRGGLSILRNRIVASIFFRLHLIERFGTGIRRINESYSDSKIKPMYETTENTIRIILPVMQMNNNLTSDEDKVYSILKGRLLSSSAISERSGFGKSKTVSILNKLVKDGFIRIHGTGRGTRYSAE